MSLLTSKKYKREVSFLSTQKEIIFRKHARERMVERNITHEEVKKTVEEGVKIEEIKHKRIRAICEVEEGRFVTVGYSETRKYRVINTAFESGNTDIELYRRLKR